MIEHLWSVLCVRAIVDRDLNSLSLIDVIEQLSVNAPIPKPGEPGFVNMGLTVASLWRRTDLNKQALGECSVVLRFPDGTEQPLPVNLVIDLKRYERMRTLGRLNGVPVGEPGTYRFLVRFKPNGEDKWTEVASLPMEVVFQEAIPPTA
jgi:hypothetical protein